MESTKLLVAGRDESRRAKLFSSSWNQWRVQDETQERGHPMLNRGQQYHDKNKKETKETSKTPRKNRRRMHTNHGNTISAAKTQGNRRDYPSNGSNRFLLEWPVSRDVGVHEGGGNFITMLV